MNTTTKHSRLFQEKLQSIRTQADVTVRFSTFTVEEAEAVAQAIQGNSLLTTLKLGYSPLGTLKGGGLPQVQALAAGLRGSSVTALGLYETGLGNEDLRALTSVLRETSLQSLALGSNGIGPDGAKALAEGIASSTLTALDLTGNALRDEGVKVLGDGLKASSLQSLDLGGNGLSVEGVQALASVLRDSSVTSLGLRDTKIDAEGAEALLLGLEDSPVIELTFTEWLVGEEFRSKIKDRRDRSFVLQVEVQVSEKTLQMKFRTLAGSEAAVLSWSLDHPLQDLPKAVLTSMRSSGFPLPFKGLSVTNLRFVRPDGHSLDVSPFAAPLAQQLRLGVEPTHVSGASSTERPQEGADSSAAS